MKANTILVSNLASALIIAIEAQKKQEAQYGPDYRSCFRAGLESNLEELRKTGQIEIKFE